MIKKKIVLQFPATHVEQPFIYYLIRDYDLMVNILRANINPRKEGRLIVEFSGEEDNYRKGLEWLKDQGVLILALKQQIIWREDRCTNCGACSVICPTAALFIERPGMTVKFDENKCVACEHCIKTCPARAMEVLKEYGE